MSLTSRAPRNEKNVHSIIYMKVAFIFIVKDGEKYLEKNINLLKRHGHDIYTVENNSVDDTKNILARAGLKKVINLDIDEKSSIDLCTLNNKEINCTDRVRRLAYIRQQGLDAVMNSGIEYDYVCMLDMDFVHYDDTRLLEMFEFMEQNRDVEGIFGMSVVNIGIPYDLGAVRPIHKIPQIVFKTSRWVRVDSAFSGFGIYRCTSIKEKNARYDHENIHDIEHVYFNKHFDHLVVDTHFNPLYEASNKMYAVDKVLLICFLVYILIRVIQRFKGNLK